MMTQKRRRGFGSKSILRDKVGSRDGWKCCYCDRALGLTTATLEHVVPRSLGGTNALDNLKLACESCNRARGNGPPLSERS